MLTDLATSLTRASGLVATVLMATSLVSGFLFSARETGTRRKPNWWLDLHNGLGGITLIAVGVHIVASFADSGTGIGLRQVFVPGTATTARWALGWGVVATYLVAGVVFTSWPKRLSNRRLWRVVHLTSVVGLGLAILHGYQMGTDATQVAVQVGLVAVLAPAIYSVTIRIVDAIVRARLTRR